MTPQFLFIKVSQASVLLPVLAGWTQYKRLTFPFRVLFYFFVAGIGFEILSGILKAVCHNNIPGLHLLVFVEFLVFSTVYYCYFQKGSILRLFIGVNTIVFLAAWLADLFINGIWVWNVFSRSYSSVSLTCYTLIYFYFLFKRDTTQYSAQDSMFWVSIGALVYFGSNMLYFILHNVLAGKAYNTAVMSIYFHAAINIIAHFLYAQAFRCFRITKTAAL